MITIRRIYSIEEPGEIYKVLVDRLWPRGISKEKVKCDEWMKNIAPSNALRKWFKHDINNWDEFNLLYKTELEKNPEMVRKLKNLERKYGSITLLYAAKDEIHNNAIILKSYLSGE